MVETEMTVAKVWEILSEIPDPEIPVLSLVDLNIVKKVELDDADGTHIYIRPTFSGCPALDLMRTQVQDVLTSRGAPNVTVHVDHTSRWSTNDIPDEARERLRSFGIAPPPKLDGDLEEALSRPVACPHCDSEQTELDSAFGSTLCKQMFVCRSCRQPFERFKPM
jgi:ring-1,2-phenylacetyl-CoA epoxidase subunit PaaD